MSSTRIRVLSFVGAVLLSVPVWAQANVKLGAATKPSSGQADVTTVSATGSGFPSGTISPSSVTVTLTPGTGSPITTSATSVTPGTGTTNTISFLIPASISVTSPTTYEVAVSGQTTGGATFQSLKSSALKVDPPPSIHTVSPNKALQGQTLTVTIVGAFTNFVSGVTQANFGPSVSVGGAAAGANGPVTVISTTKATASLVVGNTAALGSSDVTVVTGSQTATLPNGFQVEEASVVLGPSANPKAGEAGLTSISVTGSGFPSGTITPATVVVSLTPRGGGSPVTVTPTIVTPGTGTTSTVSFLIPASISVTVATAFEVAIAGETTGGTSFQSSKSSLLTVDPPSSLETIAPTSGLQGQSLTVSITGRYTNFTPSVTQASFGAGISVGGAALGASGPVTVESATKATASIFISNSAALGASDVTVVTGSQTQTLPGAFLVKGDSKPPVAVAGGPYAAQLPAAVQFNGAGSYDPTNKKAVLTYLWNFGDGTPNGTGVAPMHVYPAAGVYGGTLTVTNKAGVSSLPTPFIANITSTQKPPVAVPGGPYSAQLPNAVQFDGSGSSDPNPGATLIFSWNFGDGTANGLGTTPSHTYASSGIYNGSLTVSDTLGLTSSPVAFVVNVTNAPSLPQVTITSPDPLSVFNASGNPITVKGTVDNQNDTVTVNGIAATVSGGGFTVVGIILREGPNVITAAATNAAGNVGTTSETVTLNTTPPQLGILAPADGSILTASTVTVAGNVNEQVAGTINSKQITVTVNGIAATVSNRTFSAANVPLVQGKNVISVTAVDPAGNTSQTQVTVTYMGAIPMQKILLVSGEGQTAAVSTTLAQPLVIQVVDSNGAPVPSQQVTFSVVKSDGLLTSSSQQGQQIKAITDQNGQASVQFQLGTRVGVGNNQVAVTATGYTGQALFCESSTVGPPTQIVVEMGDGQTGIAGQALASPLELEVLDAGGNPVAYVPVTFTVQAGGGNLNGNNTLQVSTDINGMANALLTLGQQEGINNNVVSATFAGNSGAVASFVASGQAAGPASITSISGLVEDDSNTPIPGATITLEGTNLTVKSDSNGNFSIAPAPVGTFLLQVNGHTSTRTDAVFPTLVYNITTVAGINNTLGMPVCLPPLDPTSVQNYSPTSTQPITLLMTGVAGYQFTVYPGSVTNPDGTPYTGPLSLSQVHADRVPMAPPHGSLPLMAGTLQPPGLHFNPPVQAQFPNTSGLAPGSVLDIYSYDHDQMTWVSQGPGRVSADGSVIVSDPGFGISKSGWHFPPPPPPPPKCASACTSKNPCQTSSCVNGACVSMNANEGGDCEDGSASGDQCGAEGKCHSGACTFDTTATNGQSCTPESKCIVMATCQNGQCTGTPIDVTSVTDNASLVGQLNFPEDLTSGISEALSTATGGNILLDGFNISGKGTSKNCCNEMTGPIDQGDGEASGSGQLGAHVKGLPLGWGIPEIFKNVNLPFNAGQVQLDITLGVFFGADITLNGELGLRSNQCEPDNNCVFAQVDLSLEPNIYAQGKVMACESIFSPSEDCVGGNVTGGIKLPISGGVRYHKPDCMTGLQGFISISQPVAYITAGITLLNFTDSFSFQYTFKQVPTLICSYPGGCHTEQ